MKIQSSMNNMDAINRFKEETRLAAAKERCVHAAISDAARQVTAILGPSISLDSSKDTLTEIRPGVFSGRVEAQLSVDTASGIKRVAFPIDIKASKAILKKDLECKAYIESALSKVAGSNEAIVDAYAQKIDEKVAALTAENEAEQQIIADMENGMSKEEATMRALNTKAALKATAKADQVAAEIVPFSDIGINAPQPFITLSAAFLPAYKVGETISIGDLPYKCIAVNANEIKFQLIID